MGWPQPPWWFPAGLLRACAGDLAVSRKCKRSAGLPVTARLRSRQGQVTLPLVTAIPGCPASTGLPRREARLGDAMRDIVGSCSPPGRERIVVLSEDRDVRHAVEGAVVGIAHGLPGSGARPIVLRGVANGRSWFPPRMLGETLRERQTDAIPAWKQSHTLDVLSPRDRDVPLRVRVARTVRLQPRERMR